MIAADVVQTPNDKQQLEPMLGKIAALPDELGKVSALLADSGYFSEADRAAPDPVVTERAIEQIAAEKRLRGGDKLACCYVSILIHGSHEEDFVPGRQPRSASRFSG